MYSKLSYCLESKESKEKYLKKVSLNERCRVLSEFPRAIMFPVLDLLLTRACQVLHRTWQMELPSTRFDPSIV